MKERTLNWQLGELYKLVDSAFVKRAKEVKGAFTTGDYVTWLLNRIFGPHHWGFTILQGPEMIQLSDKTAYAQVVGRLQIIFADGTITHQDDIGIWPLVATGARKGGTLDETAPERYETVCKAARTDCLKNAAYNLGTCFAPLSDGVLVRWLEQNETREQINHLVEGQSPEEHKSDLFGIAQAREGDVETLRREAAINAERIASGGNGSSWPIRPWDAETLKRAMAKKVRDYKGKNGQPSEKQLDYCRSSLGSLSLDDAQRHTITLYLFGIESTGDLNAAQCSALIDWIGAKAPNYEASQDAFVEARTIIKQYQVEQGQTEMELPS